MIYDRAEDVPDEMRQALMEGIIAASRRLRKWRGEADCHELRASFLAADGELVLICHHDDRVTLIDGPTTLDVTPLVDREAA